MTISVVIPLKDRAATIRRALDSVLAQTVPPDEIVVVDGHSIDNGPDIVREYHDDRIILFTQKGTGVSRARNQAVERAEGDTIAFLDADDEWTPHHLKTLCRLTRRHPDAGIYTDQYQIRYQDGTTKWPYFKGIPPVPWEGYIPDFIKSSILGNVPVLTSVAAVPKSIFQATGGFPEWAAFGEDHALWFKIALHHPVAFSWSWGGTYHWSLGDTFYQHYPYTQELPVVTVLEEALKNGTIPKDQIPNVRSYIGKIRIYTTLRNYTIFGGTVRRAVATDTLAFLAARAKHLLKTHAQKLQNGRLSATHHLAAWTTNRVILLSSSSGGIFPELANRMLAQGGLVAGVVMDGTQAVYTLSDDPCVVERMRGSKYIPASPAPVIRELKQDSSRPVLFSGLPCHIEIVKKTCSTENMILVDIKCHGLPRAGIWEAHIQKVAGDRHITAIRFRDKSAGWEDGRIGQSLIVEFGDGDVYDEFDSYIQGYMDRSLLRESCTRCTRDRCGDITLGDFWGVPRTHRNIFGTSLVHLNTEKGIAFFQSVPTIQYRPVRFYHYLNAESIGRLALPVLQKAIRVIR